MNVSDQECVEVAGVMQAARSLGYVLRVELDRHALSPRWEASAAVAVRGAIGGVVTTLAREESPVEAARIGFARLRQRPL